MSIQFTGRMDTPMSSLIELVRALLAKGAPVEYENCRCDCGLKYTCYYCEGRGDKNSIGHRANCVWDQLRAHVEAKSELTDAQYEVYNELDNLFNTRYQTENMDNALVDYVSSHTGEELIWLRKVLVLDLHHAKLSAKNWRTIAGVACEEKEKNNGKE